MILVLVVFAPCTLAVLFLFGFSPSLPFPKKKQPLTTQASRAKARAAFIPWSHGVTRFALPAGALMLVAVVV
ncbi:MAG: hypothetical protein M0Z54_02135 [Thermaerobacter sp.]|nr:hypothetical protein [Thermaerobacter sp.]